jgi:hypothetical protein
VLSARTRHRSRPKRGKTRKRARKEKKEEKKEKRPERDRAGPAALAVVWVIDQLPEKPLRATNIGADLSRELKVRTLVDATFIHLSNHPMPRFNLPTPVFRTKVEGCTLQLSAPLSRTP